MSIKVKSHFKDAGQQKKSVELGEVADVYDQNWETIMGFKPSLKPFGAEPHNPPNMSTQNAPIPTEDDSLKPDQGELASGSGVEKENPPHEDESVDHIKQNTEQKTTSKEATQGSMQSEEDMEQVMNAYREKWTVANKIADIKIAAGQWKENDRYQNADILSQRYDLDTLHSQLQDNEQMLGAVAANKPQQTRTAAIPRGYSTAKQSSRQENPLEDILGDIGYDL